MLFRSIFVIIINLIGLLFSFLWPAIVVLVIVVGVMNFLAYRKRKNNGYYYSETTYYDNRNRKQDCDIIDVEYTETEIDEDR